MNRSGSTMIYTSSLLLLCTLGALCAQEEFIGKLPHRTRTRPPLNIFKGNKTSVSKYPYIASLQIYGIEYGAAVILNKNWLLTIAWVLHDIPLSKVSFRVGSSTWDKEGQVLKAEKIIRHPKYSETGYDYDIAVVKTDKPIKFGKNVKRIKLGTKTLKAGTKGWTAGWGFNDSSFVVPETLLEAQVTVYDWKTCQNTYGDALTERLFCTFDANVAACSIDYGDPLVVKRVLYGLFAGGYDCPLNGTPVLYTDVASLYEWVQSTIKSNEDEETVIV